LGQQFRSDTGTGLVAWEEVVAEGLNHVIEGTCDVRNARLGEQHEQAVEKTEGGADFAAVRCLFGRCSEVAAEQLISAVYKMDPHLASRSQRFACALRLPLLVAAAK